MRLTANSTNSCNGSPTASSQLALPPRARAGMSIGLYVDLAVGIDRHGADAWSQQQAVLADVSMGAPPDDFTPQGQDWGLAPLNPHALAADDFASVRHLMRAAMRHAGAMRLDHILGLNRVFMVPLGLPAVAGAYVRFPFQQLLQRHRRGELSLPLHRRRRGPRYRAGTFPRHRRALGPVVLSRHAVRARA